jgi:hypothetical protein
MRLRIVIAAALSLLVLAAFAGPSARVDAKGPTEVVVSGDGIEGVMVVRATDRSARWWPLVEATRFFEFDIASEGLAFRRAGDAAPATDLGPRIRLTWIIAGGGAGGETGLLRQDLYPFAPGGARLYTPADQTVYGHSFATGWRRVDSSVVTLLRRFGVPIVRHAVPPEVHGPQLRAGAVLVCW